MPSTRDTSFRSKLFGPVARGIALRAMTLGDVPLAAKLLWDPVAERDPARERRDDTVAQDLRQALDSEADVSAMVEQEGRAVGALRLKTQRWGDDSNEAQPKHACQLADIALERAVRCNGHGTALLEHIEEAARYAGYAALQLEYLGINPRVGPLYERAGFTTVGYDLVLDSSAVPVGGAGAGARPAFDALSGADALGPALTQALVTRMVAHRTLAASNGPHATEPSVRRALDGASAPHHRFLIERGASSQHGRFAWFAEQTSRFTNERIVILHGFALSSDHGSEETAPAALIDLISEVQDAARAHAPSKLYLTLWQPSAATLDALIRYGFSVGRFRMLKVLD